MAPNFSAYPFARLRKLSRRDAEVESTVARWLAARPLGERFAKLVAGRRGTLSRGSAAMRGVGGDGVGRGRRGGDARVEVVAPTSAFDPFAGRAARSASAARRYRGARFERGGFTIAQRLLPGPEACGAAAAHASSGDRSGRSPSPPARRRPTWPLLVDDEHHIVDRREDPRGSPEQIDARSRRTRADKAEDKRADKAEDKRADKAEDKRAADTLDDKLVVELAVTVGDLALAVQILAPAELWLRVPPAAVPAWFDDTSMPRSCWAVARSSRSMIGLPCAASSPSTAPRLHGQARRQPPRMAADSCSAAWSAYHAPGSSESCRWTGGCSARHVAARSGSRRAHRALGTTRAIAASA